MFRHMLRAIADQVPSHDYLSLKRLAAAHMRTHNEDFAPFLGMSTTAGSSQEYLAYCDRVADAMSAEWGGQVEVLALAQALERSIVIHSAGAAEVVMGVESKAPIIHLAFHRHYYALGEHYNSVESI